MNATDKTKLQKYITYLLSVAAVGFIGKVVLDWSMSRWIASDGFLSSIVAGAGFLFGFMGVSASLLILCKMLKSAYDLVKESTDAGFQKGVLVAMVPILPFAWYFCDAIWNVVGFAKACWWNGVFDTFMSFIAFFVGGCVGLITIMAVVVFPLAAFASYKKLSAQSPTAKSAATDRLDRKRAVEDDDDDRREVS